MNNNNSEILQWVTSTDLDGFKDKNVMKKVRKAAMHDYLRKNLKHPACLHGNGTYEQRVGDRIPSVGSGISDGQEPSLTSNERALRVINGGRSRRPSPQSDLTRSITHVEDEDPPLGSLAVQSPNSPQLGMENMISIPISIPVQTPVVVPPRLGRLPYDRVTVGPLQSLGAPLDPFRTMPQVSHPRVSIEELKIHCSRVFGTKAMGLSWVPALIRSRHAFLSTLCIASTHLDAINNRPTESIETIALRQEVIHLISQSLLNPNPLTRTDDFTIIALVQLICSEIVAGNETALHYHEDGMEKMVKQRGGLERLGVGGELASVLTSVSFQSAIFRGTQPKPIYLNYCKTLPHRTASRSQPIPESPLFCPRLDFETIKHPTRCAKHTLDLLTAVRDMTDLFLDNGSTISTAQKDQQLDLLCHRILSLPSSTHYPRASNPVYGDWTYEACRIAAVIQAIAITRRIPLSQACAVAAKWQAHPPASSAYSYSASPYSSSYLHPAPPRPYRADSVFHTPSPPADSPLLPSSPLHALRAALDRSDLSNCWDDMAGVLLWVALVGGAAARPGEAARLGDWLLRKWLVAMSVRCSIVLAFGHGAAVVSAQRRLLRVTERIALEFLERSLMSAWPDSFGCWVVGRE